MTCFSDSAKAAHVAPDVAPNELQVALRVEFPSKPLILICAGQDLNPQPNRYERSALTS